MLNKILDIIFSYANEEGFSVYGNRITNKYCYYDLTSNRKHITAYINGEQSPFYRIETTKDGVNFCLILSSIEKTRQVNALIER